MDNWNCNKWWINFNILSTIKTECVDETIKMYLKHLIGCENYKYLYNYIDKDITLFYLLKYTIKRYFESI